MITLVTGAGGFVGGHLLAHLRENWPDTQLHGTILFDTERRPALDAYNCALYTIDLRDAEATRRLIEAVKPDRIFHLAGQAFVPQSFKDPWETLEINIRGTLNVLDAVRQAKLASRVLVVGSADVYGAAKAENLPLTERSPLSPNSPYGVSKCTQDLLALQYAQAHGIHTVRMRPFNHIGPGQNIRFATPDWASQIASAEIGRRDPVVEVGNLEAARDFTDVRDVVRAYAMAIEHAHPGEVFNVCSGRAYSMQHILNTLIGLSTIPIEVRVAADRVRPVDIPVLYGDCNALCHRTGWEPRITLEQTLRDVLNEWRQHVKSDKSN